MTYVNATGHQEQRFANLQGLDGPSALQVAEHAANEKGRYIDAFFCNLDWATVERRLREPQAMRTAAAA